MRRTIRPIDAFPKAPLAPLRRAAVFEGQGTKSRQARGLPAPESAT